MENKYSVAISCRSDLGYLEYDENTKMVNIVLANEEAKKRVDDFLHTDLTIQIPHETLHDFTTVTIKPLENVDSLELALTRLWETTGFIIYKYILKWLQLDNRIKVNYTKFVLRE